MTSIKERIDQMLKRSIALHGTTLEKDKDGNLLEVPADKAVRDFLTTLASEQPDPIKQRDMIVEAWNNPSGEIARSLNAARIQTVGNYIVADSRFTAMYFNQITLGESDEPVIVNESKNQIGVGSVGEDAKLDQMRIVKSDAAARIGLYFVTSDWVKYKTMDVYKGRIDQLSKKLFDIAFDLTFKLDRIHYDLLNAAVGSGGAFGTFTVTGAKASRVYMAHTGIVTSHLPTTNDFVNANLRVWEQADGLTGFRPSVLAIINDYADKWANVLPDAGGQRLVPTGEIIVPSSDISNLGKSMAPANNVLESRMQEEVNRDGYTSVHYLGRDWRFIADVTIASGTCFPRFNMMVGNSYSKPNMNVSEVETNKVEHWERQRQSRCYGCAIISQWRPRACRVTYQ